MASINTFEWHPGYIVPMLYLCHIVNTMTSTKLLEPSLIFSAETKIRSSVLFCIWYATLAFHGFQ